MDDDRRAALFSTCSWFVKQQARPPAAMCGFAISSLAQPALLAVLQHDQTAQYVVEP